MKEQRRYIRFDTEGSVNIKPRDATSRSIKADLLNISYLGISVGVNEKIEAGVDVDFELVAKFQDEALIGTGKVRNVQEIKRLNTCIFRLGIEFVDVNKEAVKIIINRIVADDCEAIRKRQQNKR